MWVQKRIQNSINSPTTAICEWMYPRNGTFEDQRSFSWKALRISSEIIKMYYCTHWYISIRWLLHLTFKRFRCYLYAVFHNICSILLYISLVNCSHCCCRCWFSFLFCFVCSHFSPWVSLFGINVICFAPCSILQEGFDFVICMNNLEDDSNAWVAKS